jgi:hypothetical protein
MVLTGVASLFGLTRASFLIDKVVTGIPGRMLITFPGLYQGGIYRLLDARDMRPAMTRRKLGWRRQQSTIYHEAEEVRFAVDSPLEGMRFELSVPLGLIVPACRDALPFAFALAKKVRLPKSSAARTARTRSEFMGRATCTRDPRP